MTTPASSPSRRPLTAVFLTIVIDLLGFGLILPLLPLYADAYGASKMTVGLLFASFAGMQFLSAPVWGRVSDRIGRRPVILVGLLGSLVSYLLFALAELTPSPLPVLFVSRLLAGLFGGTITTSLAFIADVTTSAERGRGMALVGAAFGIAFMIGPALGGLGYHALGSMAPGLIAASFSLLALLYAFRHLEEPERHQAGVRGSWLEIGALRRTLRVRGTRVILLLVFVATSAFAIFESTLALLANDRFESWNPAANGWLFSYTGFWLVVAQGWFVRRYMSRVGEKRFVLLGSLLLTAGLLAIGHAPNPLLLGLAAPVAIFGFAMMTPSLASLLSRRTDPSMQGEVLGVNQATQSLARIVGPILGNSLLGVGLVLPYYASAALTAFAFLLAVRLARS